MTDTERLDWLEQLGNGAGLVHNDFNHWAVLTDGTQSLPEADEKGNYGTEPFILETIYWAVEDKQLALFQPTIREAIDVAMSYYDVGEEWRHTREDAIAIKE